MFLKILSKSVFLLVTLIAIVGVIYPGILWLIGQSIFPFQANGSILYNAAKKPIGSLLIAQPFSQDAYFHPRPSAANYDASASASSALAASNPALRARVANAIHTINAANIPADFVTTSASGLDPHISLDNAKFQLNRIANQWATKLNRDVNDIRAEIATMLDAHAHAPLWGLAGEKIINVLEMNLTLQQHYGSS